jgi:hypothetical protein
MVYDTIRKLKKNGALGEDLINAELIKYGGRELWKCIHNLIMDICNSETLPNDCNIAILCPVHKKEISWNAAIIWASTF